jgi:hypothetical protein
MQQLATSVQQLQIHVQKAPLSAGQSCVSLVRLIQGYHPERQLFVVKPAVGSGAAGVTPARGLEAVAEAAAQLLQVCEPPVRFDTDLPTRWLPT